MSKIVSLLSQTLYCRMPSRTPSLLPQTTTHNEETPSSVQHSEAIHGSRQPNIWTKIRTPTTTNHCQWREEIEGGGDSG